jgi:hypothetical protein
MKSLSHFYADSSAELIINTIHGDVIIHLNMEFAEHLRVGDKLSIATYLDDEDEEGKPIMQQAEWVERIENYITKAEHDEKLFESFVDATITIVDRYFSESSFALFGEMIEFDQQHLETYLLNLKNKRKK